MFAWRRKGRPEVRVRSRPRWSLAWLFNRSTFRFALERTGGKELGMSGLQHRADEPGTWPGGGDLSSGGLALDARDLVGDAPGGMSEQRLARLMRTIEGEIIPRLLLAHRSPHEPVRVTGVTPQQVLDFVQILLRDADDEPIKFAMAVRAAGVPVADVFVQLLGPAARELGELWCADRCSFAHVTLGLVRLQQVVHLLTPWLRDATPPRTESRTVLLSAAPGEQHTFGVSMVSEFFKSAGWNVLYEPAATQRQLIELVRFRWVDVVGLACSTDDRLDVVAHTIRDVRAASQNPALAVLVGGRVFSDDPTRVVRVGADALAGDVRQIAAQAHQLVDALGERC